MSTRCSPRRREDAKKWTLAFLLIVALFLGVFASSQFVLAAEPSTRPAASSFDDQFRVLADQNMFVRARSRPVVRDERVVTPATQPVASAEASLVLRGVVIEEDDAGTVLRAFFEDLRTRAIVRVNAGDALASGKVVEVSIDAIAFEADGKLQWVLVGDNLLGQRPGTTSGTSPGASASPTTVPTDAGELSEIERRMRERRQRNQR